MKTIALLAVMVFTVAAKAQKKDTAGYSRNLIGEWQMQTNKYSSMKFSSTNEFDYAQGVLMSVFDYNIKGDTLISVKKNGDTYKYLIEKLTKTDLTLKFIRTGYILNYTRKHP